MLKHLLYLILVLAADAQDQQMSFIDAHLPIQNPDAIVEQFKTAYVTANKPKIMVYINRDLVRPQREAVQTQVVQRSTQVIGDPIQQPTNIYNSGYQNGTQFQYAPPAGNGMGGERLDTRSTVQYVEQHNNKGVASLSDFDDRQIQELFAQRLLQAGVKMVDQQIATTLTQTYAPQSERFISQVAVPTPGDDVNVVKKSADIVIELLVRNKKVAVYTPAGEECRDIFELTATAMDVHQPGVILAQVSTSTLFGLNNRATRDRSSAILSELEAADIVDQVSLGLLKNFNF